MRYILPVLAFLCGAGIAYLNYILMRRSLKVRSRGAVLSGANAAVRSVLNIGFLIGLYFLAKTGGYNLFALLLCGALGLTLPSFLFTSLLMKQLEGYPQGDAAAEDPEEHQAEAAAEASAYPAETASEEILSSFLSITDISLAKARAL